ncbi:hypothetical protein H206_05292 [Candidatus Electrothrix aarhusensis]|uniref:Uncharacterized protein n=1 Tax=Candidatus Electrothrix aarhusensis TaxID=1859131 RepID=A0A3S3RUA7_9BACT|nr:hypothetical protein H206_05292 [Candidatus Electrothrix aarhusensis]
MHRYQKGRNLVPFLVLHRRNCEPNVPQWYHRALRPRSLL